MKRFIFVASVLLLFSFSPLIASAQGTCACQTNYSGIIPISCSNLSSACDYGYFPTCSSFLNICINCSCDPLPTNTPVPLPTNTPAPFCYTVDLWASCDIGYTRCAPLGYTSQCCNPGSLCVPIVPTNTPVSLPTNTPPANGWCSCTWLAYSCVNTSNNCIAPAVPVCNIVSGSCNSFSTCTCLTSTPIPTSTNIPNQTCESMGGKCVNSSLNCTGEWPQYQCAPYVGPPKKCLHSTGWCMLPTATLVPTRPVPKVFCKPPNGGPSNNEKDGGIYTNLGCVPFETNAFASGAMKWGASLGGGIAFLVLAYAAFLYTASGGDPKKVQAARELIVALIGGIALIIFAVMLLNYLGVNILSLGNLGFKG